MNMSFIARVGAVLVFSLSAFIISCKNKDKDTSPPKNIEKTEVTGKSESQASLYPYGTEAGKWGYLDVNGKTVVSADFDMAMKFSDGMARFRKGDKWGYIDATGKVVIEPQFERARDFKSGLAAVRVNRKFGYIDKTGKFVVQPQFSKLAQAVSEGLAAVPDSTKKFGYVSVTGQNVIPHKFSNAHEFSEGLAAVEYENKWGFIDTTGNWVLAPNYVWADKFVDGHSLVRIGLPPHADYALIDRKGDVKFRLQTLHCKTASEGLMRFELDGKWGFIDRTGKMVIPPTYDAAYDFSEGLAAVRVGNGWGYINHDNKLVINIEHHVAEEFQGGLARVTWPGGKWGYIDQTGKRVWESAIPGGFSMGSGDVETED